MLTSRMCQYIKLLIDEYGLRTTFKKNSVIGFDDLYLLLYTYWVLDDSSFKVERQRVQIVSVYSRSRSSVVVHVHCSILESNSKISMTWTYLSTRQW